MNAQDCLDLLRGIKDCVFSTVDAGGRPEARVIDVMLAEDGAIYFCTSRGKDFHKQLERDGHVAVTGLDKTTWQTVRLSGKAEKLPEQKRWIDRIFEENPSMNDIYPGDSRYILDAFRIAEGVLEFFDLGKSPIARESFALGGAEAAPKGFRITEGCIECGLCAANCPQQCVKAGTPYAIAQEHCLHCGLCFENCPVQAVERLGD